MTYFSPKKSVRKDFAEDEAGVDPVATLAGATFALLFTAASTAFSFPDSVAITERFCQKEREKKLRITVVASQAQLTQAVVHDQEDGIDVQKEQIRCTCIVSTYEKQFNLTSFTARSREFTSSQREKGNLHTNNIHSKPIKRLQIVVLLG